MYPWTGNILGLSSSRSPLYTESKPRAIKHVRHIMLFSFSFGWSSWCCQHARLTQRISHLLSTSVKVCRLVPLQLRASQKACVFSRAPLSVWSYRLSFHHAICVQPLPGKTLTNPQPYGEQATGRFSQADSYTGSSVIIQYKFVTSLKQTAGGDQRFAHICDFPSRVHVAASTCLDSKTSLPRVLDE